MTTHLPIFFAHIPRGYRIRAKGFSAVVVSGATARKDSDGYLVKTLSRQGKRLYLIRDI